tara:strand:+ start:2465 stop:2650 length:186 start_codon:yes stop_codon:yes gene_type:complete
MGAMITGKSIFNISHKEALFVIIFGLVFKNKQYQSPILYEYQAKDFLIISSCPFSFVDPNK